MARSSLALPQLGFPRCGIAHGLRPGQARFRELAGSLGHRTLRDQHLSISTALIRAATIGHSARPRFPHVHERLRPFRRAHRSATGGHVHLGLKRRLQQPGSGRGYWDKVSSCGPCGVTETSPWAGCCPCRQKVECGVHFAGHVLVAGSRPWPAQICSAYLRIRAGSTRRRCAKMTMRAHLVPARVSSTTRSDPKRILRTPSARIVRRLQSCSSIRLLWARSLPRRERWTQIRPLPRRSTRARAWTPAAWLPETPSPPVQASGCSGSAGTLARWERVAIRLAPRTADTQRRRRRA